MNVLYVEELKDVPSDFVGLAISNDLSRHGNPIQKALFYPISGDRVLLGYLFDRDGAVLDAKERKLVWGTRKETFGAIMSHYGYLDPGIEEWCLSQLLAGGDL